MVLLSADFPNDNYIKTYSPFGTSTSISIKFTFVTKSNGVVLNGGTSNGGTNCFTTGDVNASNGVIHYVESVMKLPTLVKLCNCKFTNYQHYCKSSIYLDPAQWAVLASNFKSCC